MLPASHLAFISSQHQGHGCNPTLWWIGCRWSLLRPHVPGNWDRGVSHPLLLSERHRSLIGLQETETCQSKLLRSKGREQCLGVTKPPLSRGLIPVYLLHREPRHQSLLSSFSVQSTVLRPARHTYKYKSWTLSEELTTILKKSKPKQRRKAAKRPRWELKR